MSSNHICHKLSSEATHGFEEYSNCEIADNKVIKHWNPNFSWQLWEIASKVKKKTIFL